VTILHYWLSLLNPEVEVTTFDPETELSDAQDQYQGELMKKASITNSIIMAYVEAGEYNPEVTIDYTFNGLVVVGIDRWTDSDLHLGDIITKVEGTTITSFVQFKTMIQALLEKTSSTWPSFAMSWKSTLK
jgi:PDZ domain-containing secreted protein